MELVGLRQPCQWVPDEYHLEFQPLQLVRRLHDDIAQPPAGEGHAEEVLLVVVGDADRHLACTQRRLPWLTLATDLGSTSEQTGDQGRQYFDGLRVRLKHGGSRQFNVCPAFLGGQVKYTVQSPNTRVRHC
jgi:hypothetical protein